MLAEVAARQSLSFWQTDKHKDHEAVPSWMIAHPKNDLSVIWATLNYTSNPVSSIYFFN